MENGNPQSKPSLSASPSGLQRAFFLTAAPAFGATLLAASLIMACHSFALGLPSIIDIDRGSAASASGAMAAASGLFFALNQYFRSELNHRSERALDAARSGIERAWHVLEADQPTRNIAWVNASRLVLRAQHLSNEISTDYHQREWRLFVEEWKIKFLPFLLKSHEYYFGLPTSGRSPPHIEISKSDIERLAADSREEISLKIDGYSASLFSDTIVSDNAIRAIFDFTQIYDALDDPLRENVGFRDRSLTEVENRNLYGLLAFLKIRSKYLIIGDEVIERSSLENSSPHVD